MRVEVGQLWKKRKDGQYVEVLEYDGRLNAVVRNVKTKRTWQVMDYTLNHNYTLPNQATLCKACITDNVQDYSCIAAHDCRKADK